MLICFTVPSRLYVNSVISCLQSSFASSHLQTILSTKRIFDTSGFSPFALVPFCSTLIRITVSPQVITISATRSLPVKFGCNVMVKVYSPASPLYRFKVSQSTSLLRVVVTFFTIAVHGAVAVNLIPSGLLVSSAYTVCEVVVFPVSWIDAFSSLLLHEAKHAATNKHKRIFFIRKYWPFSSQRLLH